MLPSDLNVFPIWPIMEPTELHFCASKILFVRFLWLLDYIIQSPLRLLNIFALPLSLLDHSSYALLLFEPLLSAQIKIVITAACIFESARLYSRESDGPRTGPRSSPT